MHFFKYSFSIVLLLLMLLTVAATYYRFVVATDYVVSYEGFCDAETSSCYVDCEDDECTSEYYYTVVERNHNVIFELCGESILDCEAADYCQVGEEDCSVSYCDPETEAEFCEDINSNGV